MVPAREPRRDLGPGVDEDVEVRLRPVEHRTGDRRGDADRRRDVVGLGIGALADAHPRLQPHGALHVGLGAAQHALHGDEHVFAHGI